MVINIYYDSCHAEHIKRSIVFSQTLLLTKICSEKKDLDSNVENLREWFRKRDYPEQLIKNQVALPLQSASNNSANRSKQEKETGIPLVTTYNPRLIYTFIQTKKLRKSLHLHHLLLSGVPEI